MRPITAEDVTVYVENAVGDGVMPTTPIEFADTITLSGQNTLIIAPKNKDAKLYLSADEDFYSHHPALTPYFGFDQNSHHWVFVNSFDSNTEFYLSKIYIKD